MAAIVLTMTNVWMVEYFLIPRHESHKIEFFYNSPYGYHVMLENFGGEYLVLMTNNKIEATYPDPETAENNLLVPYIYIPTAQKPLYVGLADMVTASLSEDLLHDTITAVDPRSVLCRPNLEWLPGNKSIPMKYHYTDPVDYFSSKKD